MPLAPLPDSVNARKLHRRLKRQVGQAIADYDMIRDGERVLPDYFRERCVDWHIIEQDTYSVVTRVVPEGKTMCGLCSRIRRGALYAWAAENGIDRIALGHRRDDTELNR